MLPLNGRLYAPLTIFGNYGRSVGLHRTPKSLKTHPPETTPSNSEEKGSLDTLPMLEMSFPCPNSI